MDPVVAAIGERWGRQTGGAASRFAERGRNAWPTFGDVPPTAIVSALERQGLANLAGELDELDAAEVWLCAACDAGDTEALAAFESSYIAPLHRALAVLGLDEEGIDEIRQVVRRKLLAREEGQSSRLLGYGGRGRLHSLVNVVAVRAAKDRLRGARRHARRFGSNVIVDHLMTDELSPELRAIEQDHRTHVRAAFERAVAGLESVEREVLRLHVLADARVDDIAALHGIHRSTAARWVVRIRDKLARETRDELRRALHLDAAGLESLCRAVDSKLDLSLSRVLVSEGQT